MENTARRSDVAKSQRMLTATRSLEESDSLPEPQRECNPADTLFQTSGLQNSDRINFYCFKPRDLW